MKFLNGNVLLYLRLCVFKFFGITILQRRHRLKCKGKSSIRHCQKQFTSSENDDKYNRQKHERGCCRDHLKRTTTRERLEKPTRGEVDTFLSIWSDKEVLTIILIMMIVQATTVWNSKAFEQAKMD